MNTIAVSIVIATYNRAELLKCCLHSLATQERAPAFEIIIADDGSGDHTAQIVAQFQKTCSLPITYLHQTNQGAAAARNLGIWHARGHLTAFLDDDHIASPAWVSQISSLSPNPKTVGACGRAHSLPGINWVSRYCAFAGLHEKPKLKPDGTVDHLVAGNSLILTDVLREIGGFDIRFGSVFKGIVGGGEDTALGYVINTKGYQIDYNPEAITHQRQKDSLKSVLKENVNFGCNRVLWNQLLGHRLSFRSTLWRLFRMMLTLPFVFKHAARFSNGGAQGSDKWLFPLLERANLICYEAGTLLGIFLLNRRQAIKQDVSKPS